MEEAELLVKAWGNSLGVRLPAAIAKAAGLASDQQVRLQVKDGAVIITPVRHKPLTLEARLALFDPQKHAGEVMALARVGAERW